MSQPKFVWPCWWGGVSHADKPPMIHDKLGELRALVGSLAAKKQQGGPMFPVRGAKELNQKLAQALQDLDLVAPQVDQAVTHIETANIPGNQTASGKPVFRTLAHVKATVRIGAADGSFVDFVGSGHGGDVDDKAGGKASTYGWKDAILKGLTIPHEDMVDTDDEAGESGTQVETKRAVGNKKALPKEPRASDIGDPKAAGNAAATGPTDSAEVSEGFDFVKKAIDKATTVEELDTIAANIKSGIFSVSGADRLKASTAFVARKKEIKGGQASTGAA